MVGKTILVTSGKGGVGCSTVAARLAAAYTRRGGSALIADLSAGNPAQDLLCGVAERTVYDLRDVMRARIDPRRASLPVMAVERLSVIPGTTVYDGTPGDAELIRLFETLRGTFSADVLVLDVPKDSVGVLSEFADVTLAVSDLSAASLRATAALKFSPRANVRLVLNRYPVEREAAEMRATVREALDYTGIRLGAILFNEPKIESDDALEPGRFRARPLVDVPCKNLSVRLDGDHAPLLTGVIRGRKREKMLADMAQRRLENA